MRGFVLDFDRTFYSIEYRLFNAVEKLILYFVAHTICIQNQYLPPKKTKQTKPIFEKGVTEIVLLRKSRGVITGK